MNEFGYASTRIAVLFGAFLILAVPQARSEGFPGQGNVTDWSNALPYYNRANRYINQGRYQDAVNDLNRAIEMYPCDPDFHINLGAAYRKLENYRAAESEFKQATQLNPEDWVGWSNLANASLKQNRLEETIANFGKALKCHPPAAEKVAMERDIADIKKILNQRALATKLAQAAKARGATASSGKPPNQHSNAPGQFPIHQPQKQQVQESFVHNSTDKKALQSSGWDWTE